MPRREPTPRRPPGEGGPTKTASAQRRPKGPLQQWRECPEFPGYWVSDRGEVASVRRGRFVPLRVRTHYDGRRSVTVRRFDGPPRLKPRAGCPESTARQYWVWVADLVLSAFVRPRGPGEQAVHLRAGVGDDTLGNLSWATIRERNVIRVVRAHWRSGGSAGAARGLAAAGTAGGVRG
ncbi:MAG: hypothetical protein FJ087_17320 [Deltaproteobacteria bacterium]|nr:hypothetical protein [Deltaproteobacteria bacterium]